ncbi:MAG: IS3 family transposase [Coriobacteriaceae bacterium]
MWHIPISRSQTDHHPLAATPPRVFVRGRGTRLSGEGRPAAPFRAIYKVRESAGTSLSKPQSSKKSPGAGSHCNGFFGTMKSKMLYGRDWSAATLNELEAKIDKYIV